VVGGCDNHDKPNSAATDSHCALALPEVRRLATFRPVVPLKALLKTLLKTLRESAGRQRRQRDHDAAARDGRVRAVAGRVPTPPPA